MLAKTKKGTEVSVHFIQDIKPNLNGWYCEIYLYDKESEIIEDKYDDFCIHPEDCPEQGCYDSCGGPTEEAELFARDYVTSILDY